MDTRSLNALIWVRHLANIIRVDANERAEKTGKPVNEIFFNNCKKEVNKIKNVLEQGDAYKAIVEEIKEIFQHNHMTYVDMDLFNELEQKHLSKSIEAKSSEELSQTIDEFSKALCKVAFTCEEIMGRLTPKE